MHNTYITSSSISLRTKCSPSLLSFSDHSCYLRNERFNRTPLLLCCQSSSCCSCCCSSCSCCCCCDSTRRVPVNPNLLLYGLRQSTFVQLKPSRRFLLGGGGGGDPCYDRVPVCRVGRDSYRVSCKVKGKWDFNGVRRIGRDRLDSKHVNERSKRRCSVGEIEAEVMLSLLTEEIDGDCYDSYENVVVNKRENVCDESYKKKKKNVGSGYLKGDSKFEYDKNKVKEEKSKMKVRNERSSRDETKIARTEGSNCSTYFSCASDDELERNMEVKRDKEEHMVDSSIVSSSNMKRFGKGKTEAAHIEELDTGIDHHRQEREEVVKRESTVVGSYAGRNNVNWDLRKKSEKKLSEVFVDKNEELLLAENSTNQKIDRGANSESASTNYRKDTVAINDVDRHHGSQKIYGTDAQITSSSQKQFHDTEAVNVENRRHSSRKIYSADAQMTSSSQKQFHERNDNAGMAVSTVQQESDDTRIDVNTNISQRQSTSLQSSVEEMKHVEFTKTSRESKDDSYNRYDGRWKSEDTITNREESSQILSSSQPEETLQHIHTGSSGGWRSEQGQGSVDVTSNGSKIATSTTSGAKSEMGSQESYLTSSDQIDARRMQFGLNTDAQRPIRASSFRESISNEVPRSRSQQVPTQDRDRRNSPATLMPPPTQRVLIEEPCVGKTKGGSSSIYVYPPGEGITTAHNQVYDVSGRSDNYGEAVNWMAHDDALGSAYRHQKSSTQFFGDFVEKIRPEVVKATSEGGSSSTSSFVYPQGVGSPSQERVFGGGGRSGNHGETVKLSGPEDALGSADRLQKSSIHFVGDFVEKIRHEVSTSETVNQNLFSETKSEDKNEKQTQELDSRPSDGASETQPPSNETNVPETSIHPKTETTHVPEGFASPGGTITKSNKSLWSTVAEIVRFKWGASQPLKRTSKTKSSVRSSSNESVGSEAWFSGRDPESSDQSDRVKSTIINEEGTESVKGENVTSPITADTSTYSSSGVSASGITSFGKISVPGEENLSSSGNGAGEEDKPSSSLIVQSSLPSSFRLLRRSPVVDGSFSVTGKDKVSERGLLEQQESPQSTNDGELKRRKLQRMSQLPKDRFDEWEEAYILETELRKMDEIYMHEALIEARKAADAWEVPVGAVLVQHEKIIARGFNLVEELRDSTAHAEMICIREASNALKSWRLSDTTLYVTLEPCPMCAGAILQARVDTVVWGAPNKLLGADGSWIRLFPNGGENGPEFSDKPPPPVHPFHPNMKVRRGVLATECADIMQQFFQLRRKRKKSPDPQTTLARLRISSHPSKILGRMSGLFNVMFCL